MRLLLHHPTFDRAASPFERALADIAATGVLRVACPYISLSTLSPALKHVHRWQLLTDLEAWLTIIPKIDGRQRLGTWWKEHPHAVRHQALLHAKVFIGNGVAMIGSANCTHAGFQQRVEAGVWLDDPAVVNKLAAWFDAAWQSAVELDGPTVDAAIETAPSAAVFCPPSAGRPALLANAPPFKPTSSVELRRDDERLPVTVEDDTDRSRATVIERVAGCLRRFCDRAWAEAYFDSLADLIRAVNLRDGDSCFTTTLVSGDRKFGVNVNNRSSLAWDKFAKAGQRFVYYLLPASYADALAARAPDAVNRIHRLKPYRGEADPPVLLIAPFPPPEAFGADFRRVWLDAAGTEIARGRFPSPQGGLRDLPLIRRMAINRDVRADVFERAFGPAGGDS